MFRKLNLREMNYLDIPDLINYAGDKNVSGTTLHLPCPFLEKDAYNLLERSKEGRLQEELFHFVITDRTKKEFFGCIELRVCKKSNIGDLGYWIGKPFWNKGYATEAVEQILDFGFKKLELSHITASHLLENVASGKVLVKCGFKILRSSNSKRYRNKVLIDYSISKYDINWNSQN